MNTYRMCKWVRRNVMTRAAEAYSYSWPDKSVADNLRNGPAELLQVPNFRRIDPTDLTESQMDDLDFGLWSEDSELRLIPLWLKPFLVDKFMAGSINDETLQLVERDDIDDDHRWGSLAWGVVPKEDENVSE